MEHLATVPTPAVRYRLRVWGNSFESLAAIVTFNDRALAELRRLRATVQSVSGQVGNDWLEGLTLWNGFDVVWFEAEDYDEGEDVALLPAGAEAPHGDSVVRTEYDLVSLDRNGVAFRSDLCGTDITLTSALIEWATLLGSESPAAPVPPAVDMRALRVLRACYHGGERFPTDSTIFVPLPRPLWRPIEGGCVCPFCESHPDTEPYWDTLAVSKDPSDMSDTTWLVHMPEAHQ